MDKYRVNITYDGDVMEITYYEHWARGRAMIVGEVYFAGADYVAQIDEGIFFNMWGREYKMIVGFNNHVVLDVRLWRNAGSDKAMKLS